MPIYEYICIDCDHVHEALQKLGDTPLVDCPACGKSALKKKVSAPGFRLSGSGWYETDFKSDKQKNLANSDNKETNKKSDTKQTETTKKDAKPATKSTNSKKDAAA